MRRDIAESLGEVVGTRNDAAASHYHRPNGYLAGIASRHSLVEGTAHKLLVGSLLLLFFVHNSMFGLIADAKLIDFIRKRKLCNIK